MNMNKSINYFLFIYLSLLLLSLTKNVCSANELNIKRNDLNDDYYLNSFLINLKSKSSRMR